METKKCMNEVCRATSSLDWKKGWSLKSGGLASLCYNCGLAYENSIFCETFHSEDSGWRPCRICRKMVHCGCIASRHLHECMDFGGIACISCAKLLEIHAMQTTQKPSDTRNDPFASKSMISDPQPIAIERRLDNDRFSTDRLLQLTKSIGVNNNNISPAFEQLKRHDPPILKPPEVGRNEASSSAFIKQDNTGSGQCIKGMSESVTQPSHLKIFSLSKMTPPLASSTDVAPFPSDQSKGSLQMKRHVLAKSPKPSPTASSSQVRFPRPPAEGRGRGQLLPRYWPRVTDQELQQLSGDLNSTIVPLFEKILSASDAGKIGRLVLPKACAEAYFPTINQSEGIPIKIQDIKGKEWTFQFRFWPNNNSRMYVLEGVTPCIQSMQVQAGDTVIFSRRDPGGQLVIGCRKATINIDATEPQTPAVPNADPTGDTSSSDNIPAPKTSMSEKKKARNIKNKRLHLHNNDALELRINWVKAQELLRSPPSTERSVFMVDDHEFEEFEEPPVLQKRTIFISQPSGSSSFSPEEMNPMDLDFSKDLKKLKTCDAKAPHEIATPSGLDALANAAVLGDNGAEVGPTTRHPRHRPGCTCIVCIQPPSGKGRHDPSCKCNVCLTVKRRFKTLMLRKKKRLSDRQAELSLQNNSNTSNNNNNNNSNNKQCTESEEIAEQVAFSTSHLQKGISNSNEELGKARLDLNSDPRCEDEILAGTCGMSLTALINTAGFPMDMYLGQNGLPGLGPDPCLLSRASDGVDDNGGGGGGSPSGNGEQENMGE